MSPSVYSPYDSRMYIHKHVFVKYDLPLNPILFIQAGAFACTCTVRGALVGVACRVRVCGLVKPLSFGL